MRLGVPVAPISPAAPERLFDYLKLSGINMLGVIFPFHYPTLLRRQSLCTRSDDFSGFPRDSLTGFWNVRRSRVVLWRCSSSTRCWEASDRSASLSNGRSSLESPDHLMFPGPVERLPIGSLHLARWRTARCLAPPARGCAATPSAAPTHAPPPHSSVPVR